MAKMLDFRKAKKPTLPIMLDDDLVVNVYTPSKELLEELLDSQEEIKSLRDDDDREKLNTLFDMIARILSNNRENREFEINEITKYLDARDAARLLNGYVEFVAEHSKAKN